MVVPTPHHPHPASGTLLVSAARILHTGLRPAEAMLVRDGIVVAHGTRAVLREQAPDARELNYGSAVITPGLIDGHAHPAWGLSFARGADLSECDTAEEVITALRAEAEQVAADQWVFAWGLAPHVFRGQITNAVLHEALGDDRPVYVTMFDAHSALVSDAVLKAADVTAPESHADGGGIVALADDPRIPSGHVLEFSALDRIEPYVPQPSIEEQAARLHDLLEQMARTGLTEAYVMDARPRDLVAVLEQLEQDGELPLRLRISPWCTPAMTDTDVERLAERIGRGGRRWEFDGVKLFIDGTIDGGTAWLEELDLRGDGASGFWHDPATYARRIARFNASGIATVTHAIGDRGVRFVAETLAALPSIGTQHRIDHLELVEDASIELMANHGVSACVQPTHCTLFKYHDDSDLWSQRLGKPRNDHGWRTRSLVDGGITVALGSDWPVAPFDPREILADAQLRHPYNQDTPPIDADQAIDAAQALRGYTDRVPASVGRRGGDLAIGSPADFTVWEANPLDTPAERLPELAIVATAIGGAPVFDTHPHP